MRSSPSSATMLFLIVITSACASSQPSYSTSFKEIDESVSKDPGVTESLQFRTFPVAYTTRKIPKGHTFTAADLHDHNIGFEHVPADAVISCRKLFGRKSVAPLNQASVVSVQDIGIALTPNQVVTSTARNWDKSTEKLAGVFVTRVALTPGETIKRDQVSSTKMPVRLIPCDATTRSIDVVGKKCKFGCVKNHILMQHDLTQ